MIYCMMMEGEMGSITKDKNAHFVVVSQNIFEVHINQVHSAIVKQTWLEGELVCEENEKTTF